MTDLQERLAAALADRYRLERELGAGGMAETWLVTYPDGTDWKDGIARGTG